MAATREGDLRLKAYIRGHREELIAEWEREAARTPKERALGRMRRIDHIPDILDRIADASEAEGASAQEKLAAAPDRHALERLDEGFDLAEVVREYTLLRAVVLRHWEREVVASLHPDDIVALDAAFDAAISASVTRYARARERTLVALDRISSAALDDDAGLAALLERLLGVLLETTEAVDSVAVLLVDESDATRLRMRAVVGLDARLLEGFTVRVGQGFAGRVAASAQPLEIAAAATDERVQCEAIRAAGVRALYGVPMVRRDRVIGVTHMGSRTAYSFSDEDKLLFRTAVARATALVVQVQLMEAEREARADAAAQAGEVSRLAARERAARDQAEQERAAVDRERRLLHEVLRQVPAGVAVLDAETGRVAFTNEAAARIWGRTLDGQSAADWRGRVFHVDGRPYAIEEFPAARTLRGESVVDEELVIRRDDDTTRTVLVNAAPVRSSDGRPAAVVLVYLDITARKAVEDALRREATYRERFVAILGHDLRNPLTAVRVTIDHLLQIVGADPRLARLLRRVDGASGRMQRMISELLDFTRLRSGGGMPVRRVPSDLGGIVRQVVEDTALAWRDRDLRLHITGDGQGVWDPDRVAQLVTNLVENAMAHSPADQPVEVTLAGDADGVRLEVHNRGEPIPAEAMSDLFEPFVRGPVRRRSRDARAGLGLGLYIVREIASAHDGTVDVRSSATEGTTFTVRWPRAALAQRPGGSGEAR